MSIGGLFGAAIGGVIGFFVGGGTPMGILYGASIGFALGMAVDPITPDVPSTGAPDQGDRVMSGEVGMPIADLAGTAKIAGHLLCYGGERAEPIYNEPAGAKGGEPDPILTGYKYYMSWALGIVAGEADKLYTIYKNDEVVWEGELDCPASGGEETVTLDGMGSATFYFGTDDHALNSKVGALLDDADLNVPYRHLCWCFLDDCYIGEYNRAPTMKFVVKKIPANAFSTKHEIQTYDCNPAHAEWFILHNLTGLPESWLHSSDFASVASTLWGESRGLSVLFDRQQSALNYLESINSHIDNILRYGTDAKFHPKLIRDDYTVDDLPLIDEDVMLDEPSFDRRSWIDTLNEMKVQYSEIIDVERPKPFGSLWGTGSNSNGELGLDDLDPRQIFTQISTKQWSNLACGWWHSLILCNDGTLWVTGDNYYGQLGLGDQVDRKVLTQVGSDLYGVLNGGFDGHNVVIKNDGTLWSAGQNNFGQLGLNDETNRDIFTQEVLGADWSQAGGLYHTMAIKSNGLLFGAGLDNQGQLSLGTKLYHNFPFAQIMKEDPPNPDILDESSWKQVSAMGYYTMALKTNGTLWGAGSNGKGQLGLGDNVGRTYFNQVGSSTWKLVVCGYDHALAIRDDDTLWATGENGSGELGLDDYTDRNVFTQVGTAKWQKVVCGYNFSMAIKEDGTLWGTGRNSSGQLGLDDKTNRKVFTQVNIGTVIQAACGSNHTLILRR